MHQSPHCDLGASDQIFIFEDVYAAANAWISEGAQTRSLSVGPIFGGKIDMEGMEMSSKE
jgi:hypothetical protein